LARLEWNAPAMRVASEPPMFSTDVAMEQAAAGVRFREAYRHAAAAAEHAGQGRTPEASLAARISPGASADLRLDELNARLTALAP
ncbi:MAG: argininosuccinate lyase, partial [Dokdonella sp.]